MSQTASTSPATSEKQPATFVHACLRRAPAGSSTTLNLRLPSYQLVNLSAGFEGKSGFDLIFYINNLFDENAILAFDRERGGRARLGFHIGQSRTLGVTVRKRF